MSITCLFALLISSSAIFSYIFPEYSEFSGYSFSSSSGATTSNMALAFMLTYRPDLQCYSLTQLIFLILLSSSTFVGTKLNSVLSSNFYINSWLSAILYVSPALSGLGLGFNLMCSAKPSVMTFSPLKSMVCTVTSLPVLRCLSLKRCM